MATAQIKSRFLVLYVIVCLMAQMGDANVVLLGNNLTLSFDDIEASFSPGVKGSGVNGVVYASEPLDACSPLTIKAVKGPPSPFALIVRGGCTFDEKVKNAQDAGFKAAIVYDNENSGVLVSMAGSSSGIHIYAVFVSKASGEVLKNFSGHTDVEVWILPTVENSAWSIMGISFISLLAMSAVLATCFFVRRHRIRRDHPRIPEAREFHGMSSQLVKAMPSLIFTKVQEDNCTSSMCAICLEDYSVGEKLRVLPCRHKFHAACVDLWLTSWRTFCPVCKRDAMSGVSEFPATEATPLLSSAVRLPSRPSSFRSSVAASPPRPISRHPSSHSVSRAYSVSSTPQSPNPFRSRTNLPGIHTSRSTADLANMSSPHPRISHLSSAHSLVGSHLSPPISIRYSLPQLAQSGHGSLSPHVSSSYISNSGYGSSSYYYLGGSSQHGSYLRRCGESGPSLSTMAPQSPQQFQSEANVVAGTSSAQSFRQSYLRHCGDSDASLSDMMSAQSLPQQFHPPPPLGLGLGVAKIHHFHSGRRRHQLLVASSDWKTMGDAGSSSASAARSRGPSSSSTTTTSSPAGCRGGRGCAPALGRLVRKLRRQSRLLCAARHGAASSSARCCHQYDPLSYSRNFDFGAALDDGNEACSFASRFVLAGASAAARRPQ